MMHIQATCKTLSSTSLMSTIIWQGTVYISLLLHGVKDIKIQLFKATSDVLYAITWWIYSMIMTPQGSKCGVYYFNIIIVISTLWISLVVKNYYLSMLGINNIKYISVVYMPVPNHKSVKTLGFLL